MGLDFTNIPDKEGAAVYLVYDGSGYQETRLKPVYDELKKNTDKQVFMLPTTEEDGEKVRDFYDILDEKLPAILIVRDNDELHQMWTGLDIPRVEDIIYQANQVSD